MTKAELSILLTDDLEIRALNRTHRQVDEPTDVLSFPMADPESLGSAFSDLLGDVVISLETAERQVEDGYHAERIGGAAWTLADELLFLTIHGVLHLTGYEHDSEESNERMRAEERRLYSLLKKGLT